MEVLQCVRPGVKKNQAILAVDLTKAGEIGDVLSAIRKLGYDPEIRHVSYSSGVHVLAVLIDEQHDQAIPGDHLMDEWKALLCAIAPKAIHLWRG